MELVLVIKKLLELDYRDLTNIQIKAIETGLFENNSLVVSAPTGKPFSLVVWL